MTELPKCPRCEKEIQFMMMFMPWGEYEACCGCTDCNLVLQSHGRYSPALPDEELDKVKQFEREMMTKAFEESMHNHGVTDKESADRYLQECRESALQMTGGEE